MVFSKYQRVTPVILINKASLRRNTRVSYIIDFAQIMEFTRKDDCNDFNRLVCEGVNT